MSFILDVLGNLLSWESLLALLAGTVVGIVIGALPGIGPLSGIALLLPLSFVLEPQHALLFYLTLYQASQYGGSITAIAISTPGDPNSAAMIFDGYPMTRQGKARKAFGYSLWSETAAGLVSTILIILVAPLIAGIALGLGPAEYTLLGLIGIAAVSTLIGSSPRRGLISALLGLLLGVIGYDAISGTPRLTLGVTELRAGIPLEALFIGLFALPEAWRMLVGRDDAEKPPRDKGWMTWISRREFASIGKATSIGGGLGFVMGLLPGMAGSVPPFVAYNLAKLSSKKPEMFGKGNPEGIAAPQAADAAVMHSTLVPAFSLGIPGTPTSAVILGAMMIAGLAPGPQLFSEEKELVYTLFVGLLVGTVLLWLIGVLTTTLWSRALALPERYVGMGVIVLCVAGTYAASSSVFDVMIMLLFGVVGVLFELRGLSVAALVLAYILEPIIERSLRQTLLVSSGDLLVFVQTPTRVILLLFAVLIFIAPLAQRRRRQTAVGPDDQDVANSHPRKEERTPR